MAKQEKFRICEVSKSGIRELLHYKRIRGDSLLGLFTPVQHTFS